MKISLLAIFLLSICFQAIATTPINCSPDDSSARYYRDISNAVWGDSVEFKDIVRNRLIEHAARLDRIANWDYKYSGPDYDYVPVLISLTEESAGGAQELGCMWSKYTEGDVVKEFTDDSHMVFRAGYGLFKNGELIAYYYSKIAVV